MGTFKETEFELSINKKKWRFKIIHDMPEIFGLSINDAFENWLVRTDDYTPESFKAYIDSKNIGATVYTEKQYKQNLKEIKKRKR